MGTLFAFDAAFVQLLWPLVRVSECVKAALRDLNGRPSTSVHGLVRIVVLVWNKEGTLTQLL